ncbi:isoinhibitor K-like isoform X2 [Sceloporus undulatus]|uniref:isoinhibitor K-like isoform X2 n=1 Tax=Sceloporus undulatus TaxID=8520 RepID=UPI001C4CB55E|nr:isoinhibitor K-like isoform X2 [Sceloporus undulatus]
MPHGYVAFLVLTVGFLAPCSGLVDSSKQKAAESMPGKCKLPLELGRCSSDFMRYYFSVKTLKCEMFTFRGCRVPL